MERARVCDIERGSALDGPGIRYVIFLTGCPFRCKFCHNPESWATTNIFPYVSTQELIMNVKRLENFLKFSDGGVTLSGGEALLHKDFIIELFSGLKEMDIHTAIDTCGHINIDEKLDKITELCDLFLVDVKNIYEEEHKKLTGRPRAKVIEFLKYITAKKKDIIIRIVMHSEQVNSIEYASELVKYLEDYKEQISLIELLPYHSMALHKWKNLNLDYDESIFKTPSEEELSNYADVLINAGYSVKF